jgi:hypothetical protein
MTDESEVHDVPEKKESPNDLLAKQVADELVSSGLITESHKCQLLAKLKSGWVKQEDWSLWIDIATARPVTPAEVNNE